MEDVPEILIGARSNLYTVFLKLAEKSDDQRSYVNELTRLLPSSIKTAAVWLDLTCNKWRYEFGIPYDNLPENYRIYGTVKHHLVEHLYESIKLADKYLSRTDLLIFLERLSDKAKHLDVLFEMRPMLNIRSKRIKEVLYEKSGFGVGNKTCDWIIRTKEILILIDVKNRQKPIIEHMKRIIPMIDEGKELIDPPENNPGALFNSIEDKFK